MVHKMRVRRRSRGGIEIIRVLSADDLSERSLDDPLAFERSIVWLVEPDRLPFVREKAVSQATSRTGPLHVAGDYQLVGYVRLTADAPVNAGGFYTRRIFYLKPGDWQRAPEAGPPRTGLDPRTLVPGEAGRGSDCGQARS